MKESQALQPLFPEYPVLPEPYGRFRAPAALCQIKAQDDLQAVAAWLDEKAESPYTAANYRKEVERLLLWALSRPTPCVLSGLTRDDFTDYERFLSDPQPVDRWVGPPLPRTHPDWRPFSWRQGQPNKSGEPRRGGLSEKSRKQAFDVLRALYAYLHGVGYMAVNPLVSRKKRGGRKAQRLSVKRYLDQETWSHLMGHIESMPRESRRDRQHYQRARWLFNLLYLTGARLSEVAGGRMADIYLADDGLWYWDVLGKGNKERTVPMTSDLLDELATYRAYHDLPDLPGFQEDTPLVMSITGRGGIQRKAIYLVVKEICRQAAVSLRATAPAKADKLERASTHWLRHTYATHLLDAGAHLKEVSELLGHDSVRTTEIYTHSEQTALHGVAGKLKRRK